MMFGRALFTIAQYGAKREQWVVARRQHTFVSSCQRWGAVFFRTSSHGTLPIGLGVDIKTLTEADLLLPRCFSMLSVGQMGALIIRDLFRLSVPVLRSGQTLSLHLDTRISEPAFA